MIKHWERPDGISHPNGWIPVGCSARSSSVFPSMDLMATSAWRQQISPWFGWDVGWDSWDWLDWFKGFFLQETNPIFLLNMGLSCRFSLKPIHWWMGFMGFGASQICGGPPACSHTRWMHSPWRSPYDGPGSDASAVVKPNNGSLIIL